MSDMKKFNAFFDQLAEDSKKHGPDWVVGPKAEFERLAKERGIPLADIQALMTSFEVEEVDDDMAKAFEDCLLFGKGELKVKI
jgi:hypothetical protein